MATIVVMSYAGILLNFKGKNSITKLKVIIPICLFCSYVWEYVSPMINSNSVTDFWDIVCYHLGGIIYYFIIKIFCKREEL
jgi:predicted membrane channel-forming protein YqfA (hemolysin III family)